MDNEERVAKVLRPFLVAAALVGVATWGLLIWGLDGAIQDFFRDYVDELSKAGDDELPPLPIWLSLYPIVTGVTAMATLLTIVWAYLGAVAGRALLLPSRRTPAMLVLGLIVPVINLWWPYQGVSDMVPADQRRSVPLRLWWGTHLFGTFAAYGALLSAIWSAPAAITLGVLAAVAHLTSELTLRVVVSRIATIHRSMVSRSPAPAAAG